MTDQTTKERLADRAARARAAVVEEPAELPIADDEPTPYEALERQGPTALATRGDRSQMIEQSDMIYPWLALGQGMSKAVVAQQVRPGDWYLSLGSQSLGKEVEIIPLSWRKLRRRRVDGEIVCYSDDYVTGVGDPGGDCEACPLKDWTRPTNGRGGTGIPPSCNPQHLFVVLVRPRGSTDEPMLAQVRFERTSLRAGRELLSMRKLRDPLERKPWYTDSYVLRSEPGTGPKPYYVAKVERIGPTDPTIIEQARELAGAVADSFGPAYEEVA